MPHPEELISYGLLFVIGAIPVAIALIQRAAFGVEATIGLLMVCIGVIGGIAYVRRVYPSRTREPCTLSPRSFTGSGQRRARRWRHGG